MAGDRSEEEIACRLRRLRGPEDGGAGSVGQDLAWLSGAGRLDGVEPDDDLSLLRAGYVTLTPLTLDWTHPERFRAGGAPYLIDLSET